MEVKDVSSWKEGTGVLTSGKRSKLWLRDPDDDNVEYLFKYPKAIGEVYAEVIAYLLSKEVFDVEVPETFFAVRDGNLGALSKSFIDKQEKTVFAESVDFYGVNFDAENLDHYTIERTINVLEPFNLLEDLYKMCIFDYLIANQDRHSQNWGLLINDKLVNYIFAPLYDNGSSMFNGYKYGDDVINHFLKDNNRFNAYNNRARSTFSLVKDDKIVKRIKSLELLQYLFNENERVFIDAYASFQGATYDIIYSIVQKVDERYIEENRKKLITKLITTRLEYVRELIEKGRKAND